MLNKLHTRAELILQLSMVVFIAIHLLFINLPPCSIHVWRQCNTLSVARNFAEEDMNILHPKVDRRFESNGITGTAFPAYEWTLALIYKILGTGYWISRLFSLTISLIGIYYCYRFISLISGNNLLGALTASAICWTPEFFYHSMNALPDILALSSAFASLYFFEKSIRVNNRFPFFLSILFLTISSLTKLQYLMIGAYYATQFFQHPFQKRESLLLRQRGFVITSYIICIAITLSWYKYARFLIEKSNLRDYGIEIRNAESLSIGLSILKKNLMSDWPELVFGYANTLVIIIGGIIAFGHRNKNYFLPFLSLLIIYFTYHLIDLRQMQVHHYYMLPSYFFAAGLIALGFNYLISKKKTTLILILLVSQPLLACVRIIPARWGKEDLGIPPAFALNESLRHLQNAIPDGAKIIAGPDESGCIYLYFLHKKGFGFEYSGQLGEINKDETTIQNYIRRGATYLITNDTATMNDEKVKQYIQKEVALENNFHVFQLKTYKQ